MTVENLGETGCRDCEELTALIQRAEKIFGLLLPHALDGRSQPEYYDPSRADFNKAFPALVMWADNLYRRRACCERREPIMIGGTGGLVCWCRGCGALSGDLRDTLGSSFRDNQCSPLGPHGA